MAGDDLTTDQPFTLPVDAIIMTEESQKALAEDEVTSEDVKVEEELDAVEPDEGDSVEFEEAEAYEEGEAEDGEEYEEVVDEEPETAVYDITIDGEQHQVTLKQLTQSFQLQKATQNRYDEAARAKKQVDAQVAETAQMRDQYAARLEQLHKHLEDAQGPEPDWAKLEADDPIEFVRQREAWRSKQEQRQAVEAEQQRVAQEKEVESARVFQEYVAGQWEQLQEKIPELKNPETAKGLQSSLLQTAAKYGYSPEEVSQIVDHRAMYALYRLNQLEGNVSNTPPKRVRRKKIVKPKAAVSARARTEKESEARTRKARESGKVDDVAATLLN